MHIPPKDCAGGSAAEAPAGTARVGSRPWASSKRVLQAGSGPAAKGFGRTVGHASTKPRSRSRLMSSDGERIRRATSFARTYAARPADPVGRLCSIWAG
jgi:hypothetical protein